jgi:hypothetical protein
MLLITCCFYGFWALLWHSASFPDDFERGLSGPDSHTLSTFPLLMDVYCESIRKEFSKPLPRPLGHIVGHISLIVVAIIEGIVIIEGRENWGYSPKSGTPYEMSRALGERGSFFSRR